MSRLYPFILGLILWAGAGAAEEAQTTAGVLLLNGNTGQPMTGVALFISPVCDTPCAYPNSPVRGTSDAFGKIPIPGLANLRSIQVMMATSDFMYCQDSSEHNIRPLNPDRFSLEDIRRAGVVAPNQCNPHLHSAVQPGQLIFYLRPLTLWEKLTKAPRM